MPIKTVSHNWLGGYSHAFELLDLVAKATLEIDIHATLGTEK